MTMYTYTSNKMSVCLSIC